MREWHKRRGSISPKREVMLWGINDLCHGIDLPTQDGVLAGLMLVATCAAKTLSDVFTEKSSGLRCWRFQAARARGVSNVLGRSSACYKPQCVAETSIALPLQAPAAESNAYPSIQIVEQIVIHLRLWKPKWPHAAVQLTIQLPPRRDALSMMCVELFQLNRSIVLPIPEAPLQGSPGPYLHRSRSIIRR